MFKRFLLAATLGLAALFGADKAAAQSASACRVVSTCSGITYTAGGNYACTMDTGGNLCTSAAVSASITPMAPTTATTLSVSAVSANVLLPGGTTTLLCNAGSQLAYYKFGAAGVTAATTDNALFGGECLSLAPGANTYIAGITATGTTTFNISGGAGLPTIGFIPGAAASAVNVSQIAGTTTSVNNGAADAGTIRVTPANNAPGVGALTPAAAPTYFHQVGGVYTATPPTLTDGQATALRLDADGALVAYAPPIVATGNITTQNLNLGGTATAGSAVTMTADGRGGASVQITGTWTGGLVLQFTNDGTNWVTANDSPFYDSTNTIYRNSIASGATGLYTVKMNSRLQWRITANAAMTGTAVLTMVESQGVNRVNIGYNPGVTAYGGAAEAAAVSGNPVRVAGWNGTNAYTLRTDASGQLLLGATSNLIGKVGIDQTTPGTTNGVSAAQSGTWTVQPGNTANTTPWLFSISAGGNTAAVKAASTAAVATDPAAVVAISPNNTVAVTESGTWTVQPGNTANTTPWLTSISAGGNTAAVKAASTPAAATDPAAVVAISPNNTVAVTESGTWNVGLNTGSNVVGRVGIDQTTPGTTNLVALSAQSTVAPGTAPSNAIVAGGVYNSTAPTFTNGQTGSLQLDVDGSLYVNPRDQFPGYQTYHGGIVGLASAASATDLFCVQGSGTKTITVTRLQLTGIATAATVADVLVVKRSTANTAGTSTNPTAVPNDSNNAAATATLIAYTANPTTGTLVGNLNAQKVVLPTSAASGQLYPMIQYYPGTLSQGVVLRGTAQEACINLNTTTITGGSFDIDVEWIEQ